MGAVTVDLAVVGFGKGGRTLVGALAAAGKRVVLIGRSDQMYGGTCIDDTHPSMTEAFNDLFAHLI